MGLPMALLGYYCLSIYREQLFYPGIANLPQGENIEYRMMPSRTECDSIFPWSLKEIPRINDRPLLRTDQKHARTKTMLGGAGQLSMFAPLKQPRQQQCSI